MQGGGAAAEHGLLAEEIGLGLLLEGCLEDAGAGASDALGPGEGGFPGVAALVLVDGDQGRHSLALLVLAADGVAGALGGDHDDVDVLGRYDRLVKDGEAMAEEQGLAGLEVRGNVLLVDRGDDEVGDGHHDDVRLLHGFGRVKNLEAELLGDRAALALGVEADDDLDAALLEIEGMGVSLGAEADHGAGLPLEKLQVGIFVGVDFGGHGWVGVCFWVIGDRGSVIGKVGSGRGLIS